MRTLRGTWRLCRAVLHGLHGLLVVLLRFPFLDRPGRQARICWWSAKMMRSLGIDLRVSGEFHAGAKLVVVNHVSWLDIMAVHAVCPEARFVSKAEVRHWPLVGRLVDAGGTLYIERERRRDALRVVHQIAQALQDGDSVAVFPEGTTGDGQVLLPFHANLLQAAISTTSPVQPVALRFADRRSKVTASAAYVGETTLAQSLWMLACGDGITATLSVLSARATAHADRRSLSETLRIDIQQALDDIDARHRTG